MGNRFHRARVGMTSYDPAPVAVPGDAIAPPRIDPAQRHDAIAQGVIQTGIDRAVEERQSFTETIILTGNQDFPFLGPGSNPGQVISFVVPDARVFRVDRVGWRFSDPFIHQIFESSLEIQVNSQRVPWYRDGGPTISGDPGGPQFFPPAGTSLSPVGFVYPMGSITDPMWIEPIYVPSNNLIEFLITLPLSGVADYLGVSVRVMGRLRKAGGSM